MINTFNIDAAYQEATSYFKEAMEYHEFDKSWRKDRIQKSISSGFAYLKDILPNLLPFLSLSTQDIGMLKNYALFAKTIHWIRLAAKCDFPEAGAWLKSQKNIIREYADYLALFSTQAPFHLKFRDELFKHIDGNSGLVADRDQDFEDLFLVGNEYDYKDIFFVFELLKPKGIKLYCIIDKQEAQKNKQLATNLYNSLLQRKNEKKPVIINDISQGRGRVLEFHIPELDIFNPDSYAEVIKKTAKNINDMADHFLIQPTSMVEFEKIPIISIRNGKNGTAQIEYKIEGGILRTEKWGQACILTISCESYREAAVKCSKSKRSRFVMEYDEVLDSRLFNRYSMDWAFPENDFGKDARKFYENQGGEKMYAHFDEILRYWVTFTGGLEINFLGYTIRNRTRPNWDMDPKQYQAKRALPAELRR